MFPQLAIAISTSMNAAIAETEKTLAKLLRSTLRSIKEDVDMIFLSQATVRPVKRDEEREGRLRAFADELKTLKQSHERVLRSIASL